MNSINITGIVLAGGRSSRMGEDKSLMQLNGKTLVEYAIEALKPLCGKVIVSSNHNIYAFTGCEVWPDELAVQAPMVGIYSCLRRSATEINIVLSCDMPLITTAFLTELLTFAGNYHITVPVHENGRIEPLCGIYKKSALSSLERCIESGDYKLLNGIGHASGRLVKMAEIQSSAHQDLFKNLNTPADFMEVSERLIGFH